MREDCEDVTANNYRRDGHGCWTAGDGSNAAVLLDLAFSTEFDTLVTAAPIQLRSATRLSKDSASPNLRLWLVWSGTAAALVATFWLLPKLHAVVQPLTQRSPDRGWRAILGVRGR